jgi:hypothetical protein
MLSEDKIFIGNLKEIKENIYSVRSINYFPEKSGIDVKEGVLITKENFEQLNEEQAKKQDYHLLYNSITNKVIYEYFDKEVTGEVLLKDEIKELKLQQQTTDKITADLAYELMMLKGAN